MNRVWVPCPLQVVAAMPKHDAVRRGHDFRGQEYGSRR